VLFIYLRQFVTKKSQLANSATLKKRYGGYFHSFKRQNLTRSTFGVEIKWPGNAFSAPEVILILMRLLVEVVVASTISSYHSDWAVSFMKKKKGR
jgi:hypothetical protein